MAQALPFIQMGMQAFGSLSASNAKVAAGNQNAAMADDAAAATLAQAGQQELAQRRRAAVDLGRQRAAGAQSGFDMTSGTLADLYQQSAMNAELDALNIRYEGVQKAAGFTTQGNIDRLNAARTKGMAALTAGSQALSSYGSYLGSKGGKTTS